MLGNVFLVLTGGRLGCCVSWTCDHGRGEVGEGGMISNNVAY